MAAIGYGASATGGGSTAETLVTNTNDSGPGSLRAALAGDSAKVVRVVATGTCTALSNILLGSNTTLLSNPNFLLTGYGLAASTKSNMIIRNMVISGVAEDGIKFWYGCNNFWVDHCDISNAADELLDISHASTNWTVSWVRLHHAGQGRGYAMLIGSSNDHVGDSAISGTMYNNAFVGCVGRQPHLRFGKVHFFNNLIDGWDERAVTSIYNAEFRSEGNTYKASGSNLNSAIVTAAFPPYSTVTGKARSVGDRLLNGASFNGTTGNDDVFTPPYAYTVATANDALESQILAGAGATLNDTLVPSNTAAPTIVGTARPGQRLTSTPGTWTGSPTGYVYVWQVSASSSIDGPWSDILRADLTPESAAGYGVDFGYAGRRLRLKVTPAGSVESQAAYSLPTDVIVDDDPVFSGPQTAWPNPVTTGTTMNLANGRFTISGTTYLPANTTINGPGEILFASDSAILSVTSGTTFNDVTFTGTLSSLQQFTLLHNGVASLFASPTYVDVGSGMTAPIVDNVMSINLASGTQRQVVSSLITLNSAKKYAVRAMPGFATGNGHMPMVLTRCTAAGAELGEFNPQDVGVWLSIVNTEAIKIKLGAVRLSGTDTGQVASYDLSKLLIYEVINDLAAVVGGSPHQNTSNIFVGGNNPRFVDCRFRRMKFAPAKVVVGVDAQFIRPIVRSSLGCISSQGSDRTVIEDMNSDIRALDQYGNKVPTGIAARNHNILYSGNPQQGPEVDSRVTRGVFTGASWSYECPENGNVSVGIILDGLKITAEHCGISNCATNGQSINTDIRMNPLGYIGIEIPTANGARVTNNLIFQDSVARQAHGIAASNGNIGAIIDDNWIHTGVGVQITHPANTCVDRNISVRNNTIYYSVNALAYNVGGINFDGNDGGRVGYHGMRGGGAPSVFQVWGCSLESNIDNDVSSIVTVPTAPQPPPDIPPEPSVGLVCTQWALQRVGDAFAENNTSGSAGVSGWSQCIELTAEPAGARLRTTFNWPETPSALNEIKGYPAIIWGAKPGFGPRPADPSWAATTPGTRLPLRVSDLKIFNSHVRLLNTTSLTGKGQITWDMWVQSSNVHTATFGDAPITHEIMVQLRATGGYAVPPNIGGTSLGTFTTQGYTFWVYATPVLTWQMTRFIPQIPSGSAIEGALDFMPFLDHLVSIGRVQSSHWLMSAEIGYEPEYGTGDYTIYEARFDADERTNPTGGSMPVSVSATGIDINAIMSAALALSVGSQKAKYNTDVIAAIGANPTVHLLRNGVEVYRDSVSGSLTQSGGAIVLPASLNEPPEATFVADIDTGTWVLEIRNASSPAVKLSIPVGPSGAVDALILDQDLDATRTVKFSSVQLQPPATLDVSLGGGGGGELGDLSASAAVERIINQMTTMNDRPLLGITDRANQPWWGKSVAALQAAGRSTNASAVQGARPRYDNMSTYYKSVYRLGRTEAQARAIQWPRMLAWAVFVTGGTPQDAPGVGHTASNTGVRLYPVNAWGLLPNGTWEKFMNNIPLGTPGSVNFYDNEGFTYVKAQAQSRAGPGNSTEILIPPRQLMADRGAHPYGQQIVTVDEYRYSAVFYLTACQLIRWNAGLADDRADADILIQTSADWYTDPQSIWKNGSIDWWPGACTPKFSSVVSELRYFGGCSLINGINDNLGEGMITPAQLRNNPPPIPAWS